jgi:hypothetical protein
MKTLIAFGLVLSFLVYGILWFGDTVKCDKIQEVLSCNEKLCRVRLTTGRAYVHAPVVEEDPVCVKRYAKTWSVCDGCSTKKNTFSDSSTK